MFNIDLNQKTPQIICHPQYQSLIPDILEALVPYDLKHHYILFSSGTTGGNLKGYALSRKALLENAKAVNEHFTLTSDDIWALSLPVYHIGGLSVLARASLLGNQVIDARIWDPASWIKKIETASITTIVPTQLYDLVKLKLNPPSSLRYLIVGGDFLHSSLKEEAIKLGWPVIRTFGMSEVCSQLASTQRPNSDNLIVMPIHKIKTDDNQRLSVKSAALFTLTFMMGKEFKVTLSQDLLDEEGFYQTADKAKVTGNILTHLGRIGDDYKISGHLIDMNQLKETLGRFLLKENLFNKMEFVLEDDERKGKKLVLLTLPEAHNVNLTSEIAELISPVKIDEMRMVASFERTALGKLKRKQD